MFLSIFGISTFSSPWVTQKNGQLFGLKHLAFCISAFFTFLSFFSSYKRKKLFVKLLMRMYHWVEYMVSVAWAFWAWIKMRYHNLCKRSRVQRRRESGTQPGYAREGNSPRFVWADTRRHQLSGIHSAGSYELTPTAFPEYDGPRHRAHGCGRQIPGHFSGTYPPPH